MSQPQPRHLAACAALLLSVTAGCRSDLGGKGGGPAPLDGADDTGGGGVADGTDGTDGGTDGTDGGTDGTEPELDGDGDGVLVSEGDCDDADATVFPGADELCNGRDDDCDGFSDADFDHDGDGVSDCEDPCPVQVDHRARLPPTGTWDAPFPTVQEGLDFAWSSACFIAEVADGVYYENVDYAGADVWVRSHDGPAATIIDGGGVGSVVSFASAEGEDAILEGFTLQNGAADRGAGVYIEGASAVVRGNEIIDNSVTNDGGGGGLFLLDAFAAVVDNRIEGNDACYGGPEEGCDGGGLAAIGGAPVIAGNLVLNNGAGDGGGMWLVRANALIYWNIIDGNLAYDTDATQAGQGGGVDIQIGASGLLFTNNVVTNNVASSHGGGVAVYERSTAAGEATVTHNVIAYNEVTDTDNGAGLVVWQFTAPNVRNNLIAFNDGVGVWSNSTGVFGYNLVYGNEVDWAGARGSLTGTGGNISADPRVVGVSDDGDWTDDDWAPGAGSPLIDAGDAAMAADPDGSRADIGAFGGVYGGW